MYDDIPAVSDMYDDGMDAAVTGFAVREAITGLPARSVASSVRVRFVVHAAVMVVPRSRRVPKIVRFGGVDGGQG